ncbi:MAG TPA: carboxypeptidase regulatory-like domain-containing protein [Pyrinomonadaceae bacterium]|nr:carboxypeptidase regulatory-like domain-containing protein [Pyrinomonadaceae bacterium]
MFGKILSRTLAFTFALVIFSVAAMAQDLDDVTISGKVTDSAGLPVVGATVTATMTETGESRTVVTDGDGLYRLIKLRPGTYKVKVANGGFGTQETTEIKTIAAQNVVQNFKLSPADIKAETTVTVTEEDGPAVDTSRTIVGGTITEKEIEELPVDSRNPLDLVLTLGGTAEEQLSTRDLASDRGQRGLSAPGTTPEEAGIFGLSGGAAYSNNITIDGLDNNDDRGASFRFQPSMEAVREVQVITNQFSAEYGRASGGRVNISTRGGSNRFRGRAFYFFRDEALNANTWNNNRNGIKIPPFQNNNPGATFGGPIIKDKLFFFASYERDQIADTTVVDAWVPVTASNPRFPLPAPTNLARQVTVPSQAGFPAVVVAPYVLPVATPFLNNLFTIRGDWNMTKAQSITVSYQLGRQNDLRSFSGTNRIADSLIGRIRNTDAINFTHNYVVSSNIINQFRMQYSKLDPSAAQAAGALSPAVLVSFNTVSDGGTQVFGSTSSSSDRKENRWQFQDTLTYLKGAHTWRFGFDYHHVDTTFIDRFDATGTYSFGGNGFVFFIANNPSNFAQNFNTESSLTNKYQGFFVQDDIKLRPNLTVSLGLRYERETVLKDNNNWGPRFAVAWNPFPKSDNTVIRFGAGVFYNRVLLRTVDDYTADSQTLRFNTTSANTLNCSTLCTGGVDLTTIRNWLGTQFPNPVTLDTLVPVNATQSFSVRQLALSANIFRSLAPDIQIPQSYQANLGFEREISKGLVFEANVTLNRTVRLWRETNPNAPVLPSSGLSDLSGDGRITFTDYLLGINTGTNRFFMGTPGETGGTHAATTTGAACVAGTPLCYVNVNTSSTTFPSGGCASATPNTAYCRALSALDPLRPLFSQFGQTQLEKVTSIGNSRYIGAVFELRKRYRALGGGFGASWRLSYTVSRLMDDGIVNTSDPTTPGDFRGDWSRSLADRTHRIALTATIDLPNWLGRIRFSPLFRFGSSAPFNLSAGGVDRNLDDLSNDRPNVFGPTDVIQWRLYQSSPFPAGVAQQLSLAPLGSPGTLPRNAGHGPSLWQFNVNLTREWKISERFRIRPSLEVTNPFNMRVFSYGSNFINFDNLSACTTGGALTTTQQNTCDGFLAPTRTMTHRRMRLGIRFDF